MRSPGDSFDRYIIEGVLGEGGMGVVYRAMDPKLGRRVALKVVRADAPVGTVGRTDAKSRLLQEARATAALEHPNAVAIFDVGEFEGVPFIAMELVPGRPLRAFIGDPSVPPARRVRWLADVARALSAAHKAGLVHRDIKPENVMVRDDGAVKVLDFGIARRLAVPLQEPGKTDDITTLTAGNVMVGTPLYLTPEQIRGDLVDGRADQFAWGVLAYELITGRVPWKRRGDRMALLACILTEEPEPIREAGFPEEIAAVVARALRKEPSQRFASMEDIVAILEPLTFESGRGERPAPERAKDAPRKGRAGGVAIAGGAVLVIAAAAFGVTRVVRDPSGAASGFAPVSVSVPASVSVPGSALGSVPVPVSVSAPGSAPGFADPLLPRTSSPEALAAYRGAMQALRDGNIEALEAGMLEAVRLDPELAAAEIRLAQAAFLSSRGTLADARLHLQRAARLRTLLSERDQVFLDALDPAINRDPVDMLEHEKRLADAALRFPSDVEILAALGMAQTSLGRIDEAMLTFDRVLSVEPAFMQILRMKAQLQRRKSDIEGARRTLDTCIARLPGAAGCRNERIWLNQADGRCAEVEDDARQIIAADAQSFRGYDALAGAVVTLGRPRETAEEILKQVWARAPAEIRAREELLTAANLAVTAGDFEAARRLAQELEAKNAASPTVEVHARAAGVLVNVALETGDVRGAGRIAREFLNRQGAWSAYTSVAEDVTPSMLRVELLAGLRTEAELSAARADWLDRWKRSTAFGADPGSRGLAWFAGFAAPVSAVADAEEALRVLSSYEPLPRMLPSATPDPRLDEAVGRTMLLAGRTDEAIGALRRASRMCTALSFPFVQVRARFLLGRALEEKGDREGACAAYAEVRSWWSSAKPRSLTAEKVKARIASLGCK